MRAFRKAILAGGVIFAAMQFVRPTIPVKPATAELQSTAGYPARPRKRLL